MTDTQVTIIVFSDTTYTQTANKIIWIIVHIRRLIDSRYNWQGIHCLTLISLQLWVMKYGSTCVFAFKP